MNCDINSYDVSQLGHNDVLVVRIKEITSGAVETVFRCFKDKMKFPGNLIIATEDFSLTTASEAEMNRMGWYRNPTREQIKP